MLFFIDPIILERFPLTKLGVIFVEGANNHQPSTEITNLLAEQVSRVQQSYTLESLVADPSIALWRTIYPQFGAKPRDYRSSIEALARRCVNGKGVGAISPLVDAYNAISLKYFLPAGGEDLDHVQGDLRLTIAGANEPIVKLLGDQEAQAPFPGEVIYKDDVSAICRCWNWREAERTKLMEDTKRCVLVVEDVNESSTKVEQAIQELGEILERACGAKTSHFILSKDHPQISF